MVRNFRWWILCLLFLRLPLSAQQKTFTLDDIFRKRELYSKSIQNLQWISNSDEYSFVRSDTLFKNRPSQTKQNDKVLTTLSKLNKAVTAAGGEELKRFPSVSWLDAGTVYFFDENDVWLFRVKEEAISKKSSGGEEAENHDMAPETMHLAYTLENNLFILAEGKAIQVTTEPDTGIVSGQIVHRNEWGIEKGTFWSPAGDKLAFYHMDESMVTQYPLVDIEPRPAKLKNVRYPMAGMKSHEVKVGVFDVKTQKTIFLETGEPRDQFLTNIAWTPDGKSILIAVLNRQQNHMWLRQYDALSGKFIKTLFEETDNRYVEPQTPPMFLENSPGMFLWQSKRDGYNHIYLYDMDGRMLKQVTKGNWDVANLYGTDPDDNAVWFQAAAESPVDKDIYRADMKSGKITRLSSGSGSHSAEFSWDYQYFIDHFSSLQTASRVAVLDNKGKEYGELLHDKNPLADYKMPHIKFITLKNSEGIDLYARLIKPVDFDSTRKYPVIIYVYGGPHSQLVTNTWLAGGGMFLTYLATQGYVVFTLDNRGTANRGKDFEQIIHRRLGDMEVADQMAGVEYLKSLPWVDKDRIGVHGWSYGGFLTLSMLTRHPEEFKVGVAGGPVCDWKYYEVMYGERYMDTPEENPEGYESSSLLNKAGKLNSELLIIHGGIDETVVMQHSLDFLKNCVDNGKLVDFFVYPGHEHNVSGIDRLHLYKKIEKYFLEKL